MDSDDLLIVKACLKEKESIKGEGKSINERERYLNRCSWSKEMVKEMHENGIKVQQDLIERNKGAMKQEIDNRTREAR